jgi:glycosyltransferase involved in cell wall biosynthesis
VEVDHVRTLEQRTERTTLSVLHVTQPTIDGVARSVLDLVGDQMARGWAVAVACPPDDEDFLAELEQRNPDYHPWPAARAPGPASVAESVRLARIVRRIAPDLVHLHSSKAGLAGRLALRGRRPTVFQPHAWSFEAVTGLQRRAALLWERIAVRWAHAVVCVSEGERQRGEELGIRARYRVIPNGIDVAAFTPASAEDRSTARTRLGLEDAPFVVCVGRLSRQKGQDVLLRAWPLVQARVPGAQLALVGEGPDREWLERAAPPSVLFAGNRSDVPDWLAAADVVAAPSRWEGMSIALLEALARARSVVASDTPGAAEALGAESEAIVPVEDAEALAEALARRLLDPALADAEGRAGRARVERHYDLRRALDDVAALYRELVAGQ